MVVTPSLRALVALAAAAVVAGQGASPTPAPSPFGRTADDNKAIRDADNARNTECADVDLSTVDRVSGRESLKDYMGSDTNIILKVLRESNNTDELGTKAQEEVTPGWLIKTAGSVVFSFILLFMWIICCWSACPFCKCCLCCRRQRKTGMIVKLGLLIVLAALLFGMFVSAMMALKGRTEIMGGMNSVACTSAKTMYHTLAGKPSQQYIGILPMLEQLGTIRDGLGDNSGLMTDVRRAVQDTAPLERAQYVAAQAMLLLEDTLNLPANKNRPETQQAIEALLTPIRQVNSQLSSGLGSALSKARTEVDNQLSTANRNTLKDTMDSAVAPLRSAADTVRDSLWFFIKEDFKNLKDIALMGVSGGVIGIACVIFLLAACGCSSGLCCVFRDYKSSNEQNGKNPWNKNVSRCALTTWCCGFLYGFLVFFFGGLMIVIAVPVSSMCLVLDDINSQMVRDILPALGANVGGDDFGMVADMIDNCFSRTSTGPQRSLLEIVYIMENGNKTSLQQKLRDQLVTPINSKFDDIAAQMQGNTALATNSGVTQLKSALQSYVWPSGAPPAVGFRCDIFQTSLGFDCDVKNMAGSGLSWSNDCVVGTSPLTMRRKTKSCTSAQFVTYVNEWATRIDKTFTRVDQAVTATGTKISTDLKASVQQFVTTPIDNIVANAHCTFLKTEYQDFVTGFCFQGVIGFGLAARAYVANGVLTLLLIITTYIVWRIAVDNRWSWNDSGVKPLK